MPYQNILYDKDDHIATITMNRPDKLNALSVELVGEIVAAAEEAEADDDVRVVILKGAGRAFSAGYDVGPGDYRKKGKPTLTSKLLLYRQMSGQCYKLWNLAKPLLAQVHGYCLAGANDIALSCDIVICAQDAVFGLPDVRGLGSVPTHMWTYLVGPQWAKQLMMTGDPLDGTTAERIGLVWKAVPADTLDEEVRTLARRISNVPLEFLIPHKALINNIMAMMGHGVAQHMAADTVVITSHSEAGQRFMEISEKEGLRAALQWMNGPFGDYSARPREKKPKKTS